MKYNFLAEAGPEIELIIVGFRVNFPEQRRETPPIEYLDQKYYNTGVLPANHANSHK